MDSNVQLLEIFIVFWPLGYCVWGSNRDLKVELMVLLTWKLWEWIIILTKTPDKNKNLSAQSCPHGFISWSLSNFSYLLPLHLSFECRIKAQKEIYLNGFIDMKSMGMKHYFKQKTYTNKNVLTEWQIYQFAQIVIKTISLSIVSTWNLFYLDVVYSVCKHFQLW